MAKFTAKQLAAQLGVSPAAVSIALNGKPGVSDATRRQILDAAAQMGISIPSVSASVSGKRRLCFVYFLSSLISIAENTTFSNFVMEGAEQTASKLGYSLQVRYLKATEPFGPQMEEILKEVDGIILLGTDITDGCRQELAELFERIGRLPLIIVDSPVEYVTADCVCNDNINGARMAAEYLLERGCSRIGYFRSKYRIKNFDDRETGLRRVLNHAGLPLDTVVNTGISFDDAYDSVCAYLETGPDLPDGFFAENDVIGAAAIRAFNAYRISVPERVSVIGFDDIPICDLTAPGLTTVHSFKHQLGSAAVRLLDQRLTHTGLPGEGLGRMKIFISTSVHVRGSVR